MKEIIVGVNLKGNHVFLRVNEDGTADWVEDKALASVYTDHDTALSDWHGLNKAKLRRCFIACAD